MRIFITSVLLLLFLSAMFLRPEIKLSAAEKGTVYSSFTVGKFVFTLSADNGKCILLYHPESDSQNERSVSLGMSAPCNYIGAGKGHKIQTYHFAEGVEPRTIFLVSGGLPHPDIKDRFQPNGCGTSLAGVRVFADRIQINPGEDRRNDAPRCPSQPLDEVMFAAMPGWKDTEKAPEAKTKATFSQR